MYKIAILIGVYSYSIFALGLVGLLEKNVVLLDSAIFILVALYLFRKEIVGLRLFLSKVPRINVTQKLLLVFLLLQGFVNLVGALGPELAFDSLWYHLTLPKIYIQAHEVIHIPGNLLYYSSMPKLVEMIYIPALMFGSEIVAKIIHFSFGILTLIALYQLSRKFLSKTLSLIVLLVFYSNLVVGWLSITSYVDLARTFFLVLSLNSMISFLKTKKESSLTMSGIMVGLAATVKVLSLVDVLILSLLLIGLTRSFSKVFKFVFVSMLIPLPWLMFSYISTGNPFYPFFSNLYPVFSNFNLSNITNFIRSPDPLSPIYIICLPLLVLLFGKLSKLEKTVACYGLLSLLVWLILPQTGGGRFVAAYLPALSILVGFVLKYAKKQYVAVVLMIIVFISSVNLLWRAAANYRYIPVILGKESKGEFLSTNLNFSFGDFYDIDNYLKKRIKYNQRVLTINIHNLYYANFPFIDETWVGKNDKYDYILVRGKLPSKYKGFIVDYENNKTKVKLYIKK